jgi:hypothetical protein
MTIRMKRLALTIAMSVVLVAGAAMLIHGLRDVGLLEAGVAATILVTLKACSLLLRANAAEGAYRPPFFALLLQALLGRLRKAVPQKDPTPPEDDQAKDPSIIPFPGSGLTAVFDADMESTGRGA